MKLISSRNIILSFAVGSLFSLMPGLAQASTDSYAGERKKECHSDSESPDNGAAAKSSSKTHSHDTGGSSERVNCDQVRVINEKEREKMRRYAATYVPKETIVASIEMPSGQIVDCVDMFRQPALRRKGMEKHEIQYRPKNLKISEGVESGNQGDYFDSIETGSDTNFPPSGERFREARLAQKIDSLGDDPKSVVKLVDATQIYGTETEACPSKSIPITRITLDDLVKYETLDDYFNKTPPHTQNGPTGFHQYAHAYNSNISNWGAQSKLNVWSPYTQRSSEFSLSQIWVTRGSGSNLETVETGWQKYRDLYGNYNPNLFIYFTPDNYGSGGCYNLSCGAFVQVNGSIYIGGGFSNISAHPHPSTAWEFTIRWQKDGTEGHWWLKYGNTWVGYYPRTLFDSNGLRNLASYIDFGGEIIDEQVSSNHTHTDMGSGHFPSSGFGTAAYQRQIRYITTSNFWGIRPTLSESRSDRDCYDIDIKSSSGSWERYFYFGGSGNNTHCR